VDKMTENHASDLYDAVNRWGPSDDFFLGFATAIPGARVLDLGCGTGGLTIAAANAGCAVTGVDPDHPSLQAARAKHGAERVAWIDGNSRAIPANALFDVALMTSNVVQEILDDVELARSLADIASHLVPGGRLAFDSRDPNARGWEAWTKERSHKLVHLPQGDTQHWYQTTHVDEQSGLVDFCAHEIGPEGLEHIECGPLRFRSEDQLRAMLAEAGLAVDKVFGGYHGEPVGSGVGTLTFTAHRP
jgi:2-polyprenyl-3-methyl-5-hydroxy-6-metoxy-1,4-benzoquinol methylase